MFINFWYAAGRSADLTDTPTKVRMLGQNFVLFRDSSGEAHCLSNVCTHRGGSLAGGKMRGDCVECPYHGWQFNGAGECTKIPSLGKDGKVPARTKIDSYPVQEKYGLIFAFLGDLPEDERPPILDIKEYGSEGWRATVQKFEWSIDYKRSIENSIDPAHNEFVHDTHGFGGDDDDYRVHELNLVEDEWSTGFWNKMYAPPLAEGKMRQASGREEATFIDAGTGHVGISSVWTHIHPTPEMHIHQYLFETPIEEDETQFYLVNLRNFLATPEHDERMMGRNLYVAGQDKQVLEDVEPVISPSTNIHEVFMPHDHPIALYRKKMKAWQDKGWRIDTEEVERTRKRVAYAIPSPARRSSKGWVIDSVPLKSAANASEEKAKQAAE
ncbi:MAG: aromatic ring-hydroxylating dioxygenase subunit alpha [Rhodospirillaceae bacterium]|jgi:phenylpropionate dioxygenase-like ring-hydroxylating dioxygenase large terminal subunit